MEYEKTEVNSGFFYKSAEEREKLVLVSTLYYLFLCHRQTPIKLERLSLEILSSLI